MERDKLLSFYMPAWAKHFVVSCRFSKWSLQYSIGIFLFNSNTYTTWTDLSISSCAAALVTVPTKNETHKHGLNTCLWVISLMGMDTTCLCRKRPLWNSCQLHNSVQIAIDARQRAGILLLKFTSRWRNSSRSGLVVSNTERLCP